MDHSIAAKYAARPAAHFVRPSTRVRERHLGLRPSGGFHASRVWTTVLHGPDVAPLARLRAVTMEWARSGRAGVARRPGSAPAPWPG